MEMLQIPQADLLDILFDGRNKDYGAYDLRKTYNDRLRKSLTLTVSLCLLLIGGYTLAGKLEKTSAKPIWTSPDIILSEPPVKEKPVEIPKTIPNPQTPPPQTAMLKDFPPQIVVDKDVKPEDVPHTQDDMDQARLGSLDKLGAIDDGAPLPRPSGDGVEKGIIETPKKNDNSDSTFRKVEIESGFNGGMEAWKRFLIKNFHPEQAIEQGIAGTVVVEFIVDREGNVSDVQAISGPEELRGEAVRVIKKSSHWNPAIQNGRQVKSYKRQPITVQFQSE